MPAATTTTASEPPKAAARAIAISTVGNAMRMSISTETDSRTHREVSEPRADRLTPTTSATTPAQSATTTVVAEPAAT
nr:hypothetical protein GCM10025699_49170 [Microbacterium flavescens]